MQNKKVEILDKIIQSFIKEKEININGFIISDTELQDKIKLKFVSLLSEIMEEKEWHILVNEKQNILEEIKKDKTQQKQRRIEVERQRAKNKRVRKKRGVFNDSKETYYCYRYECTRLAY